MPWTWSGGKKAKSKAKEKKDTYQKYENNKNVKIMKVCCLL